MNTISHYIRNSYSAQQNFGAANYNAESVTKQQKQQVRDIKRMLNCANQNSNGADFFSSKSQSILDSSKSYSDSLRNQRQQAKDTSLSLKKLKYQHKSISSKILRAKTSAAAKQAVSSAKREVIKLKRQRLDPDCDKEELEAAISHAKDMERVAQKKARHLELEELGFGEISGELEVYSGDMSDEDIKKMEIKHRNSEMKDIVKADADYLKTVFEHFRESIDVSV